MMQNEKAAVREPRNTWKHFFLWHILVSKRIRTLAFHNTFSILVLYFARYWACDAQVIVAVVSLLHSYDIKLCASNAEFGRFHYFPLYQRSELWLLYLEFPFNMLRLFSWHSAEKQLEIRPIANRT